jgi:response regulator RpfG family c-di-GMP phosphodiesterase
MMSVWLVSGSLVFMTALLWWHVRVEIPRRERRRLYQTLEAFSTAIQLRFPSHHGLSKSVADAALHIADELQLSGRTRHRIEMASWLRDIGLCSIPFGLVNRKPMMYWNESDHATYAQYPEISAGMLELVPSLQELAPIVRYHLLPWDGSRDSNLPQGDEIPLEARILRVAHDFAWAERREGPLLARDRLLRGMDNLYDPIIVRAFLDTVEFTTKRLPDAVAV